MSAGTLDGITVEGAELNAGILDSGTLVICTFYGGTLEGCGLESGKLECS